MLAIEKNFLTMPDRKILVTGATGWVGRSFLHELQAVIPSDHFNSVVFAFASKATRIPSTNYSQEQKINIPVHPLSSIINFSSKQHIILFHSAFLTRDRISRYGIEAFIDTNQCITDTVLSCVQASASSRVACISSGAASNAEKEQISAIAMASDPYGYLKLSEESKLTKAADTQVFRIYALTGRFIRDPMNFAVGDFLRKALDNRTIQINSPFPVIRSYVSAADVAKCALSWLWSSDKPQDPLGASSHISSLTSLATLISKMYGLAPPLVNALNDSPNSYCCSPIPFHQLCMSYNINPLSLVEQLLDTASGMDSTGSNTL